MLKSSESRVAAGKISNCATFTKVAKNMPALKGKLMFKRGAFKINCKVLIIAHKN